MATNICLDCAYFGGKCDKASEEIRECNEYIFIRREIEHVKDKNSTHYRNQNDVTYRKKDISKI